MIQYNNKILLAFSGGIDSCAAAMSLRDEGFDVELLTINMLGDKDLTDNALQRAEQMGFHLHIIDERELFEREIIEYFTSEYLAGRTPAPCTRCNTHIKWKLLLREADRRGIYHIASGHYFRIAEHNGLCYVRRGVDPAKDQSYYLWGVTEQTLRRVKTPMGELIKANVKAKSAIKKESMGICFLHGAHYTDLLCARCGEPRSGDIIDQASGEIIAQHNGIARYTIGQRRGEGIPSSKRVIGINAELNQVIIGDNNALYVKEFEISDCHFIDPDEAFSSTEIEVMVRGIGRNPKGFAHLSKSPNGAIVHLESDHAWAIAAGQPVALYIRERVIGGGYIR